MIIIWTNGVANPYQSIDSNGIWNGIKTREVTLDDILDAIIECCQTLTNLLVINQSSIQSLKNDIKAIRACCDVQEDNHKAVLSAIFDLRRELLRGNRDIRR